jgi:hypothetical protein
MNINLLEVRPHILPARSQIEVRDKRDTIAAPVRPCRMIWKVVFYRNYDTSTNVPQ